MPRQNIDKNLSGNYILTGWIKKMNTHNYICSKQVIWASNKGIKLVGSHSDRGKAAYTKSLDENLFEPMSEDVQNQFNRGSGGELTPQQDGRRPKMFATHSSSVLGVNVFHYWRNRDIKAIAEACKLCSNANTDTMTLFFEKQCEIDSSLPIPPNLDILIETSSGTHYGIESKFTEPYSTNGHGGIKQAYLQLDLWSDIPELHKLAKAISPDDNTFHHLHAAQLIKHILGLKNITGVDGNKKQFRLLYLYYDALGEKACEHLQEIKIFKQHTDADGIQFSYMSYQELIIRLSQRCIGDHCDYMKYITERYL